MLITKEDITKTSLYPEIVGQITRLDDDACNQFLMDAESKVRSKLSSKYDIVAIFGDDTTTPATPPTYTGGDVNYLKKIIKMIASYWMVRLANPNVDIDLYRTDYEDALKWLDAIQAGTDTPTLPYMGNDPNTSADESLGQVSFSSNVKRQNSFDGCVNKNGTIQFDNETWIIND